MTAVWVREEGTTPVSEEPLDWLLYTNQRADDEPSARLIVEGYAKRWRIEDFHKTWKTGACNTERMQLRSAEAAKKWATILAAVATRIERLKHLARNRPDEPATVELSADEIRVLVALAPGIRKRAESAPTVALSILAEATNWIARLGGYTRQILGRSAGSHHPASRPGEVARGSCRGTRRGTPRPMRSMARRSNEGGPQAAAGPPRRLSPPPSSAKPTRGGGGVPEAGIPRGITDSGNADARCAACRISWSDFLRSRAKNQPARLRSSVSRSAGLVTRITREATAARAVTKTEHQIASVGVGQLALHHHRVDVRVCSPASLALASHRGASSTPKERLSRRHISWRDGRHGVHLRAPAATEPGLQQVQLCAPTLPIANRTLASATPARDSGESLAPVPTVRKGGPGLPRRIQASCAGPARVRG